jgi:hypothetical protein
MAGKGTAYPHSRIPLPIMPALTSVLIFFAWLLIIPSTAAMMLQSLVDLSHERSQ